MKKITEDSHYFFGMAIVFSIVAIIIFVVAKSMEIIN